MFDKLTDRSFLSPAVAFTFIPVALTGILLLFHIRFPGIKDIHDWMGLAFVIFCAFHIVVNWKPFTGYLKKTGTRHALVVAVALTVVCGIIGINDGDRGHSPRRAGYAKVERY